MIEAKPRPGELPTIAIDTVLPGCAAAVVSASSLVNRTLPRILRLAQGARVALIGPATPLTSRLHAYGIEIIGGFRVTDPDALASVVANGGLPRDFDRFGTFVHIRHGTSHRVAETESEPWARTTQARTGTWPASSGAAADAVRRLRARRWAYDEPHLLPLEKTR